MKSKEIIDWILVVLFLSTAFSGIKLHIISDKNPIIDHQWFIWSWIHSIVALLFVLAGIVHAMQHMKWYKALKNKVVVRKAKVRRIAVLTLDTLLVLLFMSGLWLLLFPLGNFVRLGMVHYIIGLFSIVFGIGNILKRIKLLK